jgi:hypothetical protein
MTRSEAAAFLRALHAPAPVQPAPLLRPVRPEHVRTSVLFEPRPRAGRPAYDGRL